MSTEKIICHECSNFFPSIDKLSFHIRFEHGFLLGRTGKGFICGQEGCCRTFRLFSSFRRHLRKDHNFVHDYVSQQLNVPRPKSDDDDEEGSSRPIESVMSDETP